MLCPRERRVRALSRAIYFEPNGGGICAGLRRCSRGARCQVIADAQQHPRRETSRARARAWIGPAYNAAVVAAVAFGLTLRVTQYAANRSLWLDESALALN